MRQTSMLLKPSLFDYHHAFYLSWECKLTIKSVVTIQIKERNSYMLISRYGEAINPLTCFLTCMLGDSIFV